MIIRNNKPKLNKRKIKEILLYILSKKKDIDLKTLYNIFYFIDFDYYEKYEKQLTGMTYIKDKECPIPIELDKIINEKY